MLVLTAPSGDTGGSVGAPPTVIQGGISKKGTGKKKTGRPSGGRSLQSAAVVIEKDSDGSIKVPGYRGVWVNKMGKHFVKIDGKKLMENDESEEPLLFYGMDDAARKYDEVVTKTKKDGKLELNFNPDGTRIFYEDNNPASTSSLGGSASSVVPALSIINIKVSIQNRSAWLLKCESHSHTDHFFCCSSQDLPEDIKPLLRDPRQTSRTGGNSKRHVYAYRGVCRQARKGHDRWQSQISFMGVNHYLGTFDR